MTKTALIIGLMAATISHANCTDGNKTTAANPHTSKPEAIQFGIQLNTMQTQLKNLCQRVEYKEINPPQIPGTQNRQVQLDCHGFEFAGGERLAEFVFKDDALFLTWILVKAEELNKLEKSMTQTYGQANHQNQLFSAYTQHHTALRKDIPEILFYAKEAAPQFEAWFQSASQQ